MMLSTSLWELLTGEITKSGYLKAMHISFKNANLYVTWRNGPEQGQDAPREIARRRSTPLGVMVHRDLQQHRHCSIFRLVNVHRVSLYYLYF